MNDFLLLSVYRGRGGLVVRPRLRGRRAPGSKPIPVKIRRVLGLLHVKSSVEGQTSSRWCSAKIRKKGVTPGVDQRGESRSTSMWRTGFIGYNKMIQAVPEQGQCFLIQVSWEYKHGSAHLGGERIA
ncbi:hypothetical protein AVEN_256610-1 [Araneus ventricosus]|uniref:Uncharacterized protein n=1 Tax=Araneus ventricosus TaxID=182803 RepID=A0A4Y2SGC3_ARAVE|nr:hypothetical protein AVEN_256610-1 [Araneus ventricosus]